MSLLLLCLVAASLQEDPRALLLEVRKKAMLTVERLPRYLCTETINRSTFLPDANFTGRSCGSLASRMIHKTTSDRLRLDVAVSSDSEMFSWVGEDRFRNRSLAELVRGGATSTGTFASFLISIFGSNAPSFTYNGDVIFDGRPLLEFGFRVSLDKSGYTVTNKLHHAIVAYDGTFLADPKTFDLLRLTVHTDRVPEELNVCDATTILDYGSIRLNNSEFLLPKEARFHVTNADGSELENRTVFSGCHEFLGESTLRFDEPSEAGEAVAQKTNVRGLTLPPGRPFTLVLMQPIDTATAAAGDPFKARLKRAITEKNKGVLVPKGAVVTGRIVQIERQYERASQSLTLAVKVETVEGDGAPQPFQARLESDLMHLPQNLGSFDQMDEPSAGVLQFKHVTADYVIKRGLEISGSTAGPE